MRRPHRSAIRRLRRLARRDDGAVMVEFALVMPLLLLLVFGILDLGRALFMLNDLKSAVREGARFGAVLADTTDDGPVIELVESRITAMGGPDGGWVGAWFDGTDVRVEANDYPFKPITPLAGMVGMGTINLSARAVFRWERAP